MSGSSEQPPADTKPADTAATPDAPTTNDARIAELEGQIADLTDRLLRSQAEMDNIRKRTEREKIDTQKYAVTRFAGDVLAIGDNLRRAMTAVPAGAADTDPALKVLVEGVAMTEREFVIVLTRHGIKPMDAKGATFNPHLHQAVMEQQNTDVPAGSVLDVFQEGYTIEDRVLRPAMVVVAKGGFKPVGPVAATPEADNGKPGVTTDTDKPDGETTAAAGSAAEAAAKAASEAAAKMADKPGDAQPGFGKRTTTPGSGAA